MKRFGIISLLLLVMFSSERANDNTYIRIIDMNSMERYDSLFKFYSEQNSISWEILKAQAIAESNLNPNAISPAGAKGLTQFMDSTWREWNNGKAGIQDAEEVLSPFNPEHSIRAQAAYLSWLYKQTGELYLALMAYNWGIGRVRGVVEKGGGKIPKETKDYVTKIYKILKLELPKTFDNYYV